MAAIRYYPIEFSTFAGGATCVRVVFRGNRWVRDLLDENDCLIKTVPHMGSDWERDKRMADQGTWLVVRE